MMCLDVDTQLKQSRAFLQEYQDHLRALENGESFEPLLTAKKRTPKKAPSDKAESVSDSDSDSDSESEAEDDDDKPKSKKRAAKADSSARAVYDARRRHHARAMDEVRRRSL